MDAVENRLNPNTYGKNCKAVDQFSTSNTFLERFDSATSAASASGVRRQQISRCCLGKAKTAGGFIWKFSEF